MFSAVSIQALILVCIKSYVNRSPHVKWCQISKVYGNTVVYLYTSSLPSNLESSYEDCLVTKVITNLSVVLYFGWCRTFYLVV